MANINIAERFFRNGNNLNSPVLPSGILWTGLEKVLVQGLGFVQGVILARLLCPEDFGLTAMLMVFVGLGIVLAESGLGTAYVVMGGNSRKILFWNIGIGTVLYCVLFLLAPLIAVFYHEPMLVPLVRVMGLGIVLNAACAVGGAQLQRTQRFRELSAVNVVASLVPMLLAVTLAWQGAGVWSIAWCGVACGGVRFLCLLPFVRLPKDDTPIGPLLSYGGKLMLSGIIHTIYTNCYQLVIGKMFNPSAVGLFTRGQRWAVLPGEVVNEAVGRVALPRFARGEDLGRLEDFGRLGTVFGIVNAGLLWPGLVVLWVWAPEIVGTVLGTQWLDCVPYLRILLVGQVLSPISSTALNLIRASGHAEVLLKTDAWKKPLGVVALCIGAPFGVTGLCWSVVANEVIETVTDLIYARRIHQSDGRKAVT